MSAAHYLSPEERIKVMVEQGSKIHPQYAAEFDNGVSGGRHRIPWAWRSMVAVWNSVVRWRRDPAAVGHRLDGFLDGTRQRIIR